MVKKKAIVLFSGGQDSTTCLSWALKNYDHVETIGINYGQRNIIELKARKIILKNIAYNFPKWCKNLKQDHVINFPEYGKLSSSSLTSNRVFKKDKNNLPSSFVPGRNIFFFTIAASIAYNRKINDIIAGVCQTDYLGYPDCRNNTINSLQLTVNLGMESNFNFITPLMWLEKADIWKLACEIGGEKLINIIIDDTHTCYRGERKNLFSWGKGCNNCPACKLRSNGWKQFIKLAK